MSASSHTEQQLLTRIAHSDESAFATLIATYQPRLQGYITGITKSSEVAEEIVMDVFLKLWIGRTAAPEIQNVNAFLFTIAHHLSLNFLKKLGRDKQLSELMWKRLQIPAQPTPEQAIVVREYEQLLREAIEAMPEQRRKVYKMSREQDLSYSEIAEQLQISKNTVSVHITEAQRFIRTYLTQKLGTATLVILMADALLQK